MHNETGMNIMGAVDDIWVNPEGELIVVDYKSTSKDDTIDKLDADWHIGYKRQMEVYQWLLRQNGFKVSNTGYFVYANASTKEDGFNNRLVFETTLIAYEGNDDWVEPTILETKACLEDSRVPKASGDCDYCRYREFAGKKLLKSKKEKEQTVAVPEASLKPKIAKKDTLF